MRRMKTAICFVTLLFSGVQAMCLQAADRADYYPLKPGSKWQYAGEVNGQKIKVTNQVAKMENIDGKNLARLETLNEQMQVVAAEHLASSEKGVFRHRINGIESEPPFCILQYPVKSGDTWKANSKVGNETIQGECKAEKEEVTVPAGKYSAVKVTINAEVVPSGQKINNTIWLADDVGLVKQITDLGQIKIKLELEKFEAGK